LVFEAQGCCRCKDNGLGIDNWQDLELLENDHHKGFHLLHGILLAYVGGRYNEKRTLMRYFHLPMQFLCPALNGM